jgi:glutamate synthase domain-containing protein 3
MPIFNTQLRSMESMTPLEAVKHMANHIRYIQEQLEYTLMNLDSSNVTELNTDETNISSGSGGSSFSGDSIKLSGPNGESFAAGMESGVFRFKVTGRNGAQVMYMTSDGQLIITNNATISVDGGTW